MVMPEFTAVVQVSERADDERWPLLYTCLFVVGSSALLWTMIIIGGVRVLIA